MIHERRDALVALLVPAMGVPVLFEETRMDVVLWLVGSVIVVVLLLLFAAVVGPARGRNPDRDSWEE